MWTHCLSSFPGLCTFIAVWNLFRTYTASSKHLGSGNEARYYSKNYDCVLEDVCVRVCYLEVADVSYHVREERVACNVEWNTQSLCVCVVDIWIHW